VLNSSPGDYTQHHNWFQYYPSTANPTHARPSSMAAVGFSVEADGKTPDPANHEYDTDDFFAAVEQGNYPSVAYLKAPAFEDAHPGNSDPLDEQAFVTQVVNFLQQQPDWSSTAVIVTYDDSDGWYDHVSNVINPSSSAADSLSGTGSCMTTVSGGATTALPGVNGLPSQGRCGYGPRLPLIAISPFAKPNFIDHTLTDQTSLIHFVEDNWLNGQRIGQGSFDSLSGPLTNLFDFTANTPTLILDPNSGALPGAQAALEGD
jgi:phospholipase C